MFLCSAVHCLCLTFIHRTFKSIVEGVIHGLRRCSWKWPKFICFPFTQLELLGVVLNQQNSSLNHAADWHDLWKCAIRNFLKHVRKFNLWWSGSAIYDAIFLVMKQNCGGSIVFTESVTFTRSSPTLGRCHIKNLDKLWIINEWLNGTPSWRRRRRWCEIEVEF